MADQSLSETMLHFDRNSKDNLSYYQDLENFFATDTSSDLLKLRSFALYTPRQVISDFLVKFELFKKILDVPGSIVECGVFNGQGLLSFAHFSAILEPNNINRLIYGFDTFEGFHELGAADKEGASEHLHAGGYAAQNAYERIQQAIALFDRNRFIGHVPKLKLIKGNILETLDPFLAENQHLMVSLLYLDLDLYEPTKHVIERILPLIPKGGIVAFDELNVEKYPGETKALLELVNINDIALQRFPFCSRIAYFQV